MILIKQGVFQILVFAETEKYLVEIVSHRVRYQNGQKMVWLSFSEIRCKAILRVID